MRQVSSSRVRLLAAVVAGALAVPLGGAPARAQGEKIRVVTSLHVLAAVARDVGGDQVEVEALSRATEDPHEVTATPARMVKVRDADAFIENGLQLEIWSENVIDGARNPKIRKTSPGYCKASVGCAPLEVPEILTRERGDIHPFGNPHIWFEPFVGHIYAKNIEACLARVAPDRAELWEKNRKAFDRKLDEAVFGKDLVELMGGGARLEKLFRQGKLDAFLAEHKVKVKEKETALQDLLGGLMKKARPLKGANLLSYHQSWAYLAQTYGCKFVGTMEPKPGIAPSPGHLQELEATAKRTGAKVIVVASYEPLAAAESFAERFGGKVALVPADVDAEGTKDFFDFQELLVDRIAGALPKQ